MSDELEVRNAEDAEALRVAHERAPSLRKLSSYRRVVWWPPEVGMMVHVNTGYPHTSWEAKVEAVICGEVVVLSGRDPTRMQVGGGKYCFLWPSQCETSAHNMSVRVGPLPNELKP